MNASHPTEMICVRMISMSSRTTESLLDGIDIVCVDPRNERCLRLIGIFSQIFTTYYRGLDLVLVRMEMDQASRSVSPVIL